MKDNKEKGLSRCSAPFYVQFELTQKCNNKCFFCYNEIGEVEGQELSCDEAKNILNQLAEAGVFRVNFNGGEPLYRSDFFDICRHAKSLGLDLHMNTNATLITDTVAAQIADLMPSVCVSLLSSDPYQHDKMSGRKVAYYEVLAGMDALHKHGVKFEVNVCTTTDNYKDLYAIAEVAAAHGCYTLCSTRYILTDKSKLNLTITPEKTLELANILLRIKSEVKGIEEVSLPGPVPFCELSNEHYETLSQLNVPCQFGYGLCRISSTGLVTPCPISSDIIADLRKVSFIDAWNAFGWQKYTEMKHVPDNCKSCEEFSRCRTGCVVYDECLISCGVRPTTHKWN